MLQKDSIPQSQVECSWTAHCETRCSRAQSKEPGRGGRGCEVIKSSRKQSQHAAVLVSDVWLSFAAGPFLGKG